MSTAADRNASGRCTLTATKAPVRFTLALYTCSETITELSNLPAYSYDQLFV